MDNYLPAHATCNNYRWDYTAAEFQEILKLVFGLARAWKGEPASAVR